MYEAGADTETVSVGKHVTLMDVCEPMDAFNHICQTYTPKLGCVITVDGELVYRIDVFPDGGAWVYKTSGELRAMTKIHGVSVYQYMGDLSDLM